MINTCIHFLEEAVKKYPHKIAIVDESRQYTFEQLREQAVKFSLHIPIEWKNQPIAVYLPKSADCIVAFLGILYSANFYVPMDTKSPPTRLAKIIEDLRPKAIVVDISNRDVIKKACSPALPNLWDLNFLLHSEPKNRSAFDINRARTVVDTDPIYCIYTSGSTGTPKGVVVSHRSVVDFINWATQCYAMDASTIIGNQSPFIFDVSVLDIFATLKVGATVYLIPEKLFSFPSELIDFLIEKHINFIIWVPSVLINVAKTNILEKKRPTGLHKVLFAGEVMPSRHLNHWRQHMGDALFSNLYGPTEATVIASYYIVDRNFEDQELIPIGFPCENTDLFILNEAGEAIFTSGEIGELYIRGTSLALGYWNDEKRTGEVFIQNPLNRNFPERVYRTGDLVKLNDRGEIIFLGRKDSQIKHAGYRIELGEIESAAMKIEGLDEVCSVYNEVSKQIALYFVSTDAGNDESAVWRGLTAILPKYMLPTLYIKLEAMPLTATGKVDKVTLRRQLS
jgi:D-alanine--poly(phosphoribitol) ligase subunit 1